MKRRRSSERAAALLLVLAAVALLTVVAVELAARASADSLRATRAARDGAFRRLVDSGVEFTRGIVVETEPTKVCHWGQPWNSEARFSAAETQNAVIRISDESGKLNIARAITHSDEAPVIHGRVRRLFGYLARHDPEKVQKYKSLESNVLARISSLDPLPTLDGLRETGLELSQIFGSDGLSRYLTCFGDGAVNLNTAPNAVLAALDPEFDDAMVDRIAGYRGKGEGRPGSYKPFEEPQDLMLVEGIVNRSVGADGEFRIVRNLYEKVKGFVTVRSRCFSGRIEATVDGRRREAWAFFTPDGACLGVEELAP